MADRAKPRSRVMAGVHETARDLYQAGAIDKTRMAEFDAFCLGPVPSCFSRKIRALRRRHGMRQEVLASALNTRVTTIRQWESGVSSPKGASLRLLEILDRKALAVMVQD